MYSLRVRSADGRSDGDENRSLISVDSQQDPALLSAFSLDMLMYIGIGWSSDENLPAVLRCFGLGVMKESHT